MGIGKNAFTPIRFAACGLILCALLAASWSFSAENATDAPGLILTFENQGESPAKAAPADARVSRMAALYLPQGSSLSSFRPPGAFRATFTGDLNLRLRSYVRFSAAGRGKLTLNLNGAAVLQSAGDDWSKTVSNEVRLNKGKNHLVITYQSPSAGDASLRIFWSSRSFHPEPLPPMLLTHATADEPLARSTQVRDGQFLFAQFRCIQCHAEPDLTRAGAGVMPELAMDAPSLSDVGARLNRDWMAAWINNPRALRPNAHMPRLFKGEGFDPRAKDIATYLASSSGSPDKEPEAADAETGGRIYANLDCVACHTPPDGKDDPTRIPHKYVAAKFNPGALRKYLLDPAAHYLWNPMPNFHLSEKEADDLAAFLLSGGAKMEPAGDGDVANGKRLVTSSGCLNCHQLGAEKSTLKALPLKDLTIASLSKGCLAPPAAHGAAPDFGFSNDQRSALVAFLSTNRSSLARTSAVEFAERQIAAMRCTACHARDGDESLLAQSLDAEAQSLRQRYPNPPAGPGELWAAEQRPPTLTWAGEKLRPEWMTRFIAGQLDYKPRYFLRARMPSFGTRARLIGEGLAEEHGCSPALDPNPKPNPQLAEEGRKLCGKVQNVGFSCVQCHAVADVAPFAPFEAPSINFQYVAERLRHDYYMRWMHDPLRIDAASKMPRFDDNDGKTGLPAFGNDAQSQFEAIWQYLLEGRQMQPPP
jgi:mono/diheme cytochrome c family protein